MRACFAISRVYGQRCDFIDIMLTDSERSKNILRYVIWALAQMRMSNQNLRGFSAAFDLLHCGQYTGRYLGYKCSHTWFTNVRYLWSQAYQHRISTTDTCKFHLYTRVNTLYGTMKRQLCATNVYRVCETGLLCGPLITGHRTSGYSIHRHDPFRYISRLSR